MSQIGIQAWTDICIHWNLIGAWMNLTVAVIVVGWLALVSASNTEEGVLL